jgi:hypothetical protein
MGSVGQYTHGWLPISGTKTATGFTTRAQSASVVGMGYLRNAGAQNDEFTDDFWLDTGTWKAAAIYNKNTDEGIFSILFNGVSQGTVDAYAAVSDNNYSELAGLVVATAAITTVKVATTSKNGSSSGYFNYINSVALIRTAGTASIAAGSDLPGYTWHYLSWMGSKSNVGISGISQSGSALGGGKLTSAGGAQNNEVTWDIWLDAGTFKFCMEHDTSSDRGIYTVSLDGASQGTIDEYAASGPNWNAYNELTGLVLAAPTTARNFKLKMATKNGSSSGYFLGLASTSWIRTGA